MPGVAKLEAEIGNKPDLELNLGPKLGRIGFRVWGIGFMEFGV